MYLLALSLSGTFIISYIISHFYLMFFFYESIMEIKNITRSLFSFIFGLSNVVLVSIVLEIAEVDDFQ